MPTVYTNIEPASAGTLFTAGDASVGTVNTNSEPATVGTAHSNSEPSSIGTDVQQREPLQGFGKEPFGNDDSDKADYEVSRGFGDPITVHIEDNSK